jgi:hypothetical protein
LQRPFHGWRRQPIFYGSALDGGHQQTTPEANPVIPVIPLFRRCLRPAL